MKKKLMAAMVLSAAVLTAGCAKEQETAEPQDKEVQTLEIENKEAPAAENEAETAETENTEETTEETDSPDFGGTWYEMIAGRCIVDMVSAGGDDYDISVHWGSSAFESSNWVMRGTYYPATNLLEYKDARFYIRTYSDENNYTDDVKYEDGSGVFWLEPDGKLGWQSDNADTDGIDGSNFYINSNAIEAEAATTEVLPAYVYPGPELFYTVLYDYVIDEIGQYMTGGVVIPDIMITGMDESDRDDIKVYGDFACYTYTANGDTLERNSGGSYPGCIHVKSTDEGYTVTGIEHTDEGGMFDESVDRIFGDQAESFRKAYSDDAEKERVWTQILANYVAANGLDYKYVKDYGWDPIELPAENIDSFYSSGL